MRVYGWGMSLSIFLLRHLSDDVVTASAAGNSMDGVAL